MRIDARFCSNNCRVNSHKQSVRDQIKEQLLTPKIPEPLKALPSSDEWLSMIEHMTKLEPEIGAVGYKLGAYSRKTHSCNWFPNPRAPLRIVDGETRAEPYYLWQPFEPPSVPEIGYYELQFIGSDGKAYPEDTQKMPYCYVPIADPRACFHGNRKLRPVAPAVLRRQAALAKRASQTKE